LPAADGTIALIALSAEVEIASSTGRRWEPLEGLVTGPGETVFDRSREILTRFRFATRKGAEGSAFARVMRPQGIAIAILNLACWLRRQGEAIVAVRLSLGPSGPRPRRLHQAEKVLTGQSPTEPTLIAARDAILEDSSLRTSPHRASADYRRHLVRTLLERTVPAAFERASEPEAERA
jgi:carbon-monoxide dehydrogenase medium subunit